MSRRLALLLVLALLPLGAAACGGGEEVAPTAEEVQGTTETETAGTTTEGATTEAATTEAGTTETAAAEGQGNVEAGKAIYAAQGCGGCHVLQAAGSSGNVGPNLDETRPSFDKAVERVTNGQGVMPAFKDKLSEQEIRDVAAFVSQSTRG